MTEEFIRELCADLKIQAPQVVYSDHLRTVSMRAMISSDGTELVLRRDAPRDPDLFFAIAHELRHGWQIAHPETGLMDGYKSRPECADVVEYNLQPAELDANAYAAIVMRSTFGLRPLFQGLPEMVKNAIKKRINEIERDEEKC